MSTRRWSLEAVIISTPSSSGVSPPMFTSCLPIASIPRNLFPLSSKWGTFPNASLPISPMGFVGFRRTSTSSASSSMVSCLSHGTITPEDLSDPRRYPSPILRLFILFGNSPPSIAISDRVVAPPENISSFLPSSDSIFSPKERNLAMLSFDGRTPLAQP